MTNRSGAIALGATLELTTGSESGTYRLAVMPRFRHWLTPAVALDLAAGVALPPVAVASLVLGLLASAGT